MAGAVQDVELRGLRQPALDQSVFDQILNQVDIGHHFGIVIPLGDQFRDHVAGHVPGDFVAGGAGGLQGLADCDYDAFRIELDDAPVAFLHLQDGRLDFHKTYDTSGKLKCFRYPSRRSGSPRP